MRSLDGTIVGLYLVMYARADSTGRFSASHREVADFLGCSPRTAQRLTADLVEAGAVDRLETAHGDAAAYQLRDVSKRGDHAYDTSDDTSNLTYPVLSDLPDDDASRARALTPPPPAMPAANPAQTERKRTVLDEYDDLARQLTGHTPPLMDPYLSEALNDAGITGRAARILCANTGRVTPGLIRAQAAKVKAKGKGPGVLALELAEIALRTPRVQRRPDAASPAKAKDDDDARNAAEVAAWNAACRVIDDASDEELDEAIVAWSDVADPVVLRRIDKAVYDAAPGERGRRAAKHRLAARAVAALIEQARTHTHGRPRPQGVSA